MKKKLPKYFEIPLKSKRMTQVMKDIFECRLLNDAILQAMYQYISSLESQIESLQAELTSLKGEKM
jgi:hypothetical protein